jgi:hypothetical protein
MTSAGTRALRAAAILLGLLVAADAALAQPAESRIGAWRYTQAGPSSFAARAAAVGHDQAYLEFRCQRQGPVSIVAALAPGEKLGSFADGQVRRRVALKLDGGTTVDKDWFYPDESRGETELTRTLGVDSVDMLKIVERARKTIRASIDKGDGSSLELDFDVAGADQALGKLLGDCKSER